jgi:hypothetical protein
VDVRAAAVTVNRFAVSSGVTATISAERRMMAVGAHIPPIGAGVHMSEPVVIRNRIQGRRPHR